MKVSTAVMRVSWETEFRPSGPGDVTTGSQHETHTAGLLSYLDEIQIHLRLRRETKGASFGLKSSRILCLCVVLLKSQRRVFKLLSVVIAVCGQVAQLNLYIYLTLLNNVVGFSLRACFLFLSYEGTTSTSLSDCCGPRSSAFITALSL